MTKTTIPIDTYFWLGEEAELTSLTEQEFRNKVKETENAHRKWLNVSDGDGGTEFIKGKSE